MTTQNVQRPIHCVPLEKMVINGTLRSRSEDYAILQGLELMTRLYISTLTLSILNLP